MPNDENTVSNSPADIPVLSVQAESLPEAWEKAMVAVWDHGTEVRTEYDADGAPPSLDATVMIHVESPLAEPRIHKNIPGGPTELEVYRQEVVEGIHDHWIDPAAGKWTYTYHERLFSYQPVEDLKHRDAGAQFEPVNQIDYMVRKLSEAPHSRRAQAITWIPQADPETDDPPCLQRLWGRLLPERNGDGYCLSFNAHWRSRDLLMAWFMNVFALTDLQNRIAGQLEEKLQVPVRCGRYVDVSDSLHIYGSYRDEDLEAEVEKMKTTPYTDRAWHSEKLQPFFEEARDRLAEDPDYYARGGQD